MIEEKSKTSRDTVFISKATPADDEFALWLAPRLEAAGYKVFADIMVLEPGDRWRKVLTAALQEHAVKLLLCCSDTTLAREGVQEEMGIGLDLAKNLADPRFVIPLRLEPYKKVFGIGELQYIDFHRGWAEGLSKLLETLKRQRVPCNPGSVEISPHWDSFRRRSAVALKEEPERLTSNWLRVAEVPDVIRYFEAKGASAKETVQQVCKQASFPTAMVSSGFVTFATLAEITKEFSDVGRFTEIHAEPLLDFVSQGSSKLGIAKQDASNIVVAMFRRAWEEYCRARRLLEYSYSAAPGFHVSGDLAKIGMRIPWGHQGERRWSMLRNVAKGHVWQFGITAMPGFWPYPHFKLKSRVLFAPENSNDDGDPYNDVRKQHRLRRSVCKGWRNKQWHGRLRAFLELLSIDSAFITLPLSPSASVKLVAQPILFTSPVSTQLPDALADDEEEADETTLGRPEPEEAA